MVNSLDSLTIPKYVNQLAIPSIFKPNIVTNPATGEDILHSYTIYVENLLQQILPPGFPKTEVMGYGGKVIDSETGSTTYVCSTPGATFEAYLNIPINVKWVNCLTKPHMFAVDPTLHWANPNNMLMPIPPFPQFPPGFLSAQHPVPTVTHLHGGMVRSDSDGGPDSWFTAGQIKTGLTFSSSNTYYPNRQDPTTLWYHDHTLGITRLNVYAGLAGFYLLRDPKNPINSFLPNRKYDIPIVIQDRLFYDDGSLRFPSDGTNTEIHPYWRSTFAGDTIMVNGRVWPNLNVERRLYRFRVLNGSNDRIYNLKLSNNQPFIQIGSDGGFLQHPVIMNELLLGPGERADILVDFSRLLPNTKILMTNTANTPFPNGDPPDPNTVGQIMQFTALDTSVVSPAKLPSKLNNIPTLTPDVPRRILTLYVVQGPDGPLELLLDGQKWGSTISEKPIVGSTEEWEIVNLTNGSHPIHVHLIQFRVANRQKLDKERYQKDWIKINGKPPLQHPTIPLPVERYLQGNPIAPAINERGWKDTVLMPPGYVTRLKLRFAPQNADPKVVRPGVNTFPFDPSYGPGYVWHCHILEHEDNEMMRPLIVKSNIVPIY